MLVSTVIALAAAAGQSNGSYRVLLTLEPERRALRADVDIRFPKSAPTTSFILGRSFKVHRVSTEDASVAIVASGSPVPGTQMIEVRRRVAGPLHLHVDYSGKPSESDAAPIDEVSARRVELNLDSFWIPVQSSLASRFSSRTIVRGLPRNLTVVAQGRILRSNGEVVLDREVPDRDISFVAAPQLRRVDAPGFELYAANPSARGVQLFIKHGAAAAKFLTDWFGAMPGAPSRIVVVNRKRKSGYARVGYVVVHEDDQAKEADVAKYIAHEFSHAWWSPVDPMTDDRWLSESIAEYVALRYVESALGGAAMQAQIANKLSDAANAGPLLGHGPGGDAELYAKGPVLLIDLEHRIGQARLDEVLRRLAHDPPHRTADFMAVLTAVAGADAAASFERRLRS